MSTPHTEGRVTFREDGDANHWSMLAEDGRWLLALLHNGEAPSERQVANFRRLVACWNALIDLPQEALDGGWTRAGLEAHALKMEQQAHQAQAQRDELLAALKEARRWIGDGECSDDLAREHWTPEYRAAVDRVDATIAKVTGEQT